MKKCINCSKQVVDNAKKCKYCWKLVEKESIKVKRCQKFNSNRNDIEQLLCPICGCKYKKQWIYWDIFCDECMKVFFDETRWRNSHTFLDKYISYDDLRRWEHETAIKRSCHEYGFSHCIVCDINNVDKTWDPHGIGYWWLAEGYYYDFFLCKECIEKFLAAYNVRLQPWEESMLSFSHSLEEQNTAPLKKFKRIWLQVRIYVENMKAIRKTKIIKILKIVWILLVLVLIIWGIVNLFI